LRMNRTMQRSGVLAVAGLNEVGANVLGAVANDVRTGAAFRADLDPWQYATVRGQDAIPAGAGGTAGALPSGGGSNGAANGQSNGGAHASNSVGIGLQGLPKNGDLKPFGPLNQFSAEVITVAEPNWPAEKP